MKSKFHDVFPDLRSGIEVPENTRIRKILPKFIKKCEDLFPMCWVKLAKLIIMMGTMNEISGKWLYNGNIERQGMIYFVVTVKM